MNQNPNPYAAAQTGRPGTVGCRVHYFTEVASTQDLARELARGGAGHGEVVVAERQTAGRGRLGRSWHSPAGVNFYGTFILRPAIPLAQVAPLSLVAGVAVAEALETVAPKIVSLKWPNDVWLNGRKAAGLIAEAVTDSNHRLTSVLLGIGINLNLAAEDLPPDLRDKATSVLIATGRLCDRAAFADSLFANLDARYSETIAHGFDPVRKTWLKYSALTGRRVTVVDGANRIGGVVTGIDREGALLLDDNGVTNRILAGDVSIEGAYD